MATARSSAVMPESLFVGNQEKAVSGSGQEKKNMNPI
jgi:hypothetical protein